MLIPGFEYGAAIQADMTLPAQGYRIDAPNIRASPVRRLQEALAAAGVNPGIVDGLYGPNTAAGVAAFQAIKGLMVDGEVGPSTAAALGVDLDG